MVTDSNTLQLAGTINNKGSIAIKSTGNDTGLVINDSAALQGGGKVVLSDSLHNFIHESPTTSRLVNVDNIIWGAGKCIVFAQPD